MTEQKLIILNENFGIEVPQENIDVTALEKNIRVLITKMKASHMNEDGSRVDYEKMSDSDAFVEFCKNVAKLKTVNADVFSENKKKAFYINIYNSLTIHAMVYQASISNGKVPESPMKVPGFWKIHAYKIGGQVFNLDEIEHGVLRSNRGHPSAGKPEFSDSDPRHKMALTSLDPRIHFALNCGASSCPPIRIYTEDRIDQQLTIASQSFLQQEVIVSKSESGAFEVSLSKLFLWYGDDFGSSPESLVSWISAFVSSDLLDYPDIVKTGFNVSFRDYNWSSNSLGDGEQK